MKRVELPIEGMTCDHCVRTVTGALESVPGVRSANAAKRGRMRGVRLDICRERG